MCIQNILCINAFCSSNFIFVAETLCKEVCSRSCINRAQPTKNSKRQKRDNYKKTQAAPLMLGLIPLASE